MYYQLKRELPELENRAIELRIFISKLELQYNGLSHQIESLKQDLENKKITLDEYEERTSELMKQKIALGDKSVTARADSCNVRTRLHRFASGRLMLR